MNPINEIVVTYVANALWMTCVIAAVTAASFASIASLPFVVSACIVGRGIAARCLGSLRELARISKQ